ncbi:BrnT family toxin [Acidithiobacillus sp. HP-11]|nr:BrnT family toxin [Acidithiobacillus sp. HP-11]
MRHKPNAFDPSKRQKTREECGLDFEDAPLVFTGKHFTREDDRKDYGETRLVTVGMLRERMVVMVWTPRNIDDRHIISMRKANEREQAQYTQHLD